MYCPKCKNEIKENEQFCAYCGYRSNINDIGSDLLTSGKNKSKIIIAVISVVIVSLLLCIFLVSSIFKQDSSDKVTVANTSAVNEADDSKIEASQQELSENSTETDAQALFTEKLSELTSTYGIFKAEQSGTITEVYDSWFEPDGVMSANIEDFDSDGSEEMLVCISEKSTDGSNNITGGGERNHIILNMYEIEDGNVKLSDSFTLGAYIESEYIETNKREFSFASNISWKEVVALNLVTVQDKKYIMCEERSEVYIFANGSCCSYWLLEYVGGSFRYAASFVQDSPGSSDFTYHGYDFKDGACISSRLYYSESYDKNTALYDNFEEAISSFFEKYGIKLKFENALKSILLPDNDITPVFLFVNECQSDLSSTDYDFKATLNSHILDVSNS